MTAPDDASTPQGAPARPSTAIRFVVRSIRGILSLGVLAAALYGGWWMLQNPPKPKRRRPPPQPAFVEVTPVAFGPQRVTVPAMGKVRAAEEVDLTPRVRGEVTYVSRDLAPGNLVRKGQVILRIDAADYQVAVQQAEGAVKQAEASLALEEGKQALARKEYELLGKDVAAADRDLVLRQPQLVTARATLATARAALSRARLDLGRTSLPAPFNAIVQTQVAHLGARVTESSVLVKLVGTDAFWVELVVPVDALRWIRAPQRAGEEGDVVKIFDPAAAGNGAHRVGRIFRLAADLEDKGRMAKVLVRVEDPLALAPSSAGQPRLIIGSYVRAEIAGAEIASAAVLDRRLIRDGRSVWVMGAGDTLEVRPVEIVFGNAREVYVTGGLKAGERVVTTDLATPVPGLVLKLLTPGAAGRGGRAPGRGDRP
jgi:RND family efflux transporter MFP subunit